MNKIEQKLDNMVWKVRRGVTSFLYTEDGDTNFLSIIIILAIVLLLAIAFMAFKDQILKTVNEAWTNFSSAFGSQQTSTPATPIVPE